MDDTADTASEMEENVAINGNSPKFHDKDPEVVQPEPLELIVGANPAPAAGAGKESVLVHDRSDQGQRNGKHPYPDRDHDEPDIGDPVSFQDAQPGVYRDGQNK